MSKFNYSKEYSTISYTKKRYKKKKSVIYSKCVVKKKKVKQKVSSSPAKNIDVSSNDFLNSYEWKTLRIKALMLYGAKCCCCGATPNDGEVMNVDHIKPRVKYPLLALNITNLQVLCASCNKGKGNWLERDFRNDEQINASLNYKDSK